MITVTYELAQKMKDKGFEQNTIHWWYKTTKGWSCLPGNCWNGEHVAAPTADEIAIQLIDISIIESSMTAYKDQEKYLATSYANGDATVGCGDTLAEALGNLWLELKERGLV